MAPKAMPQKKKIEMERDEFFKVSKELAEFYHALETLHTNLVMFVRNNPDKEAIVAITDKIITFCESVGYPPCDNGYVWDEGEQACIRVKAPAEQ